MGREDRKVCLFNTSNIIYDIFRFIASLRGHVNAVYQISWSSDSRLLTSGSSDSTLKVLFIVLIMVAIATLLIILMRFNYNFLGVGH